MKNRDARSLPPEKQEDMRKEAVRLVLKDGKTRGETAKMFGVSRQTVEIWVKDYRKNGIRALQASRRGRPEGGSLSPDQLALIKRILKKQTPAERGLSFNRWTRTAAVQLIKNELKINVSVWTAGRYLRRLS